MSAPILKYFKLEFIYPPVAQPDNAADSDSEERGFKSLRAGHFFISALQRFSLEISIVSRRAGPFL